jgi:hypothetical protein
MTQQPSSAYGPTPYIERDTSINKDLEGENQVNIYSTIMNAAKIAGLFNTPAILYAPE